MASRVCACVLACVHVFEQNCVCMRVSLSPVEHQSEVWESKQGVISRKWEGNQEEERKNY